MEIIEQPQHIPSSQTVPEYFLAGKPIVITPFQFDAMNFICFEAQKQISKKYGLTKTKQIASNDDLKLEEIKKFYEIHTQDDLFNFLRNQEIEINLNDIAIFTNKYKNNNTSNIYKELEKLQDIKVKVNQFKVDSVSSNLKASSFHLISRIDSYSNNVVKLKLEHELIFGWIFEAIPFNKVLIKEQATLATLYTKHIYALCSEYQGMGKYNNGIPYFEVEFESFKKLLGLKAPNVSKLKGNYLNKAITEINDKTIFNITMCKGRKEKGINYIRFEYTVDEIPEMTIENQIIYSKKESIARERLEKAKGFEKIRNEEAWIKKTISSITDEDLEKIENEEEALSKLNSIDIKDYTEKLSLKYGDLIRIDGAYLNYIFTNKRLTNSAIESLEILENL